MKQELLVEKIRMVESLLDIEIAARLLEVVLYFDFRGHRGIEQGRGWGRPSRCPL